MSAYTSISFQSIAERYNRLNALPQTSAEEIGAHVVGCMPDGKRLLDMGSGAGRFALPIAAAGGDVVALDLEREMLRVSAETAPLPTNPHHLQGTVTQLPFPSSSFDAVFTANVLHLVDGWQTALAEAKRLLKPDGTFIIGRDVLDAQSRAHAVRSQWRQIVGTLDPSMRPTGAAGPGLIQAIGQLGGRPTRPIVASTWYETLSVCELLSRMERRERNDTWALPDDLLATAIAQLRPWAAQQFGELNIEENIEWQFQLLPIQFSHN